MEIKQQLRLTQQLVMTPQLQQAIRLLQLSRLEVIEEIRKELDDNPVLSEDEAEGRRGEAPASVRPEPREIPDVGREGDGDMKATEKATREVDWEKFLENRTQQQSGTQTGRSGFDDLPPIEQNLTKPRSLPDHLLWQLQMSDFTEEERKFAEL